MKSEPSDQLRTELQANAEEWPQRLAFARSLLRLRKTDAGAGSEARRVRVLERSQLLEDRADHFGVPGNAAGVEVLLRTSLIPITTPAALSPPPSWFAQLRSCQ